MSRGNAASSGIGHFGLFDAVFSLLLLLL